MNFWMIAYFGVCTTWGLFVATEKDAYEQNRLLTWFITFPLNVLLAPIGILLAIYYRDI